ncbi:MAG TPA: bifunctional hydroxymethylpyrimidine kinase/phosphomethylpyrimidine kinase [Solirubrobacteraceae bacterium]|jgi:hydroxymethylpyrimidine/phosphomethylpyrimidine kinase
MARDRRDSAPGKMESAARPGRRTPVALTIAGSDSGGGAGIQADLKAFARCGVHGTSAITAITAQNTLGVAAVHQVPPEIVIAQVRAVLGDIRVDAVKVGMLGSADVALAVAHALEELPAGTPVVVDPVMVAESGARLLAEDAQETLIAEIVPRASVLTPNLPEARVLAAFTAYEGDTTVKSGNGNVTAKHGYATAGPGDGDGNKDEDGNATLARGEEDDEVLQIARAVLALGPGAVVLTGGHRARAVDLLLERAPGEETGREAVAVEIPGERHRDGAAHGSGCTHSSVLAARLALGDTTLQAARIARALAGEAVAHGLRDVGSGAGPVDVLGLQRMRESL